ncbi:MAG TPA: hypothetical protein VGN20_12285 [Mucilaginibacter sp.]|jgi:hypothetical protein
MKKIIRILTLILIVTAFAVTNSKAQIVVRVRPEPPHTVAVSRPYRPSPHHIWVSEEWGPAHGAYAYHAGYWAVPPRPHAVWVAGHWRHHHGGYVWVAGFWR